MDQAPREVALDIESTLLYNQTALVGAQGGSAEPRLENGQTTPERNARPFDCLDRDRCH